MTHKEFLIDRYYFVCYILNKMFTKIKKGENMNNQVKDILKYIFKERCINQRMIAQGTGYSLGMVNKCIKELIKNEFIDNDLNILNKSVKLFEANKPENAIILAAGFGMRMVPINTEVSKGMLEVNGEPLIERTIKQLNERGITKIYIVVGFMKEQYEYLIDKYNVELVVNPEYAEKNNLHSVRRVVNYLSNSYIIPCDIWCKNNPYDNNELYSWYMVSDLKNIGSTVSVNRKREIISVKDDEPGNVMIGISYLTKEISADLKEKIISLCENSKNNDKFWEEALFTEETKIQAKIVESEDVAEINTYEQLRELDGESVNLNTNVIELIAGIMQVEKKAIKNIDILKKGMTNRSFIFECNDKRYIMRMPDIGANELINRKQEAEVYKVIRDSGISDEVLYINPNNGYKITRYVENAEMCNPNDEDDVKKCMRKLRKFHSMKLKVGHEFQMFERIEFYEKLWNGQSSVYRDYEDTKKKVYELKEYIEKQSVEKILCHIDPNCDNFLISKNNKGEEEITLIDWEYSGMQDSDIDIAMFGMYAMYDRKQMDRLIDIYFDNQCKPETRIKIYCYIAISGLMWSNWCEYKRNQGVDFGEYSLRQYRYAKEYYRIFKEELSKLS